jgi:hypothetical protein
MIKLPVLCSVFVVSWAMCVITHPCNRFWKVIFWVTLAGLWLSVAP